MKRAVSLITETAAWLTSLSGALAQKYICTKTKIQLDKDKNTTTHKKYNCTKTKIQLHKEKMEALHSQNSASRTSTGRVSPSFNVCFQTKNSEWQFANYPKSFGFLCLRYIYHVITWPVFLIEFRTVVQGLVSSTSFLVQRNCKTKILIKRYTIYMLFCSYGRGACPIPKLGRKNGSLQNFERRLRSWVIWWPGAVSAAHDQPLALTSNQTDVAKYFHFQNIFPLFPLRLAS